MGSVLQILRRTLDAATLDPLLCRNPSLTRGILQFLVDSQDFNDFVEDSVVSLSVWLS